MVGRPHGWPTITASEAASSAGPRPRRRSGVRAPAVRRPEVGDVIDVVAQPGQLALDRPGAGVGVQRCGPPSEARRELVQRRGVEGRALARRVGHEPWPAGLLGQCGLEVLGVEARQVGADRDRHQPGPATFGLHRGQHQTGVEVAGDAVGHRLASERRQRAGERGVVGDDQHLPDRRRSEAGRRGVRRERRGQDVAWQVAESRLAATGRLEREQHDVRDGPWRTRHPGDPCRSPQGRRGGSRTE